MKLINKKISTLLVTLLALPTIMQARDFRAADNHNSTYPTVVAVKHMGELLSSWTNERLGIKMYSGAQLGQEKDTIEQTIAGAIDINRINLAPLNSMSAETVIPGLPYLFRSVSHMRKAMDGAPGDKILKSLEQHGMIGLAFYDSGARSFYNTKREIKTPADMKGLKIRVQNSDLYISIIEALGANATPMAFGEVYTALKTGVIDGAENNWPSYESTRHFEVAKYYSLDMHALAPEVLVMSKISWDKLSTDDQKLVKKAAKESVTVMRQLWDERVKSSRSKVLANGNKVESSIDTAAFYIKMGPVYKKYASTNELKQLVKDIRAIK